MKRELYCTSSHEWIEFQGVEAIVGVTGFRLTGARKIRELEFVRIYGFKKKGDVLANIQFDTRRVQVHMPMDGSVIGINNKERLVSQDILLQQPESEGWLVKILVSNPYQKTKLLSYDQYKSLL